MSIKQVLSAAHQAELLNRDFRIETLTAERNAALATSTALQVQISQLRTALILIADSDLPANDLKAMAREVLSK